MGSLKSGLDGEGHLGDPRWRLGPPARGLGAWGPFFCPPSSTCLKVCIFTCLKTFIHSRAPSRGSSSAFCCSATRKGKSEDVYGLHLCFFCWGVRPHPLPGPEAPQPGPQPSLHLVQPIPAARRLRATHHVATAWLLPWLHQLLGWATKMRPEPMVNAVQSRPQPVVTSMTRSGHDPCPATFAPKQQLSVKRQDC